MRRIETVVRVEYFGFMLMDSSCDLGATLHREPDTNLPIMEVCERGIYLKSPANYHEPKAVIDIVETPLIANRIGLTPGSWGTFEAPSGHVILTCIMPSPTDISFHLPWNGKTVYRAIHSNPLSLTEETVTKANEQTEVFGITLWSA